METTDGNQVLRHALVAGWFSFQGHGHATAGDLLAAELTCDWLEAIGFSFELALDPPFEGGIDWRCARSNDYSHVIFVCGPFGKSKVTEAFMRHFAGCQIIGLNLTMNQRREAWNPFDFLIERNNSLAENADITRPDIVFLSSRPRVPVTGVCLVEPYGAKHEQAAFTAIERLVNSREMSIVQIDTRLDHNKGPLRSPLEVESLLAKMDVVVTTRLHGTVLSLKNGVPVVAIDPGGDSQKIKRLADRIGWPQAFLAEDVTDSKLNMALDFCLSEDGRRTAVACRSRAIDLAGQMQAGFHSALRTSGDDQVTGLNTSAMPPTRTRIRIGGVTRKPLDW